MSLSSSSAPGSVTGRCDVVTLPPAGDAAPQSQVGNPAAAAAAAPAGEEAEMVEQLRKVSLWLGTSGWGLWFGVL